MLYVNGCSFAWGQGAHPSNDQDLVKPHRFSYLLAQSLGIEEYNGAVPGSSNQRIARRSFIDILTLKPKLAIIVWSQPSRIEFTDYRANPYKFGEDARQFRVSQVETAHESKEIKAALRMYFEHLSGTYSDIANTMYYAANVKMVCDSLNIPCIQMWITDKCMEMVRESEQSPSEAYIHTFNQYKNYLTSDPNVWMYDGPTFADISNNKIVSEVDQHPNAEGHYDAYLYLKEKLS